MENNKNNYSETNEEFFNFNTHKHMVAKPPTEAYRYYPNLEEEVEFDEKNPKKILRRIFEGRREYLPYEAEKLSEFKEYIIENQHSNSNSNASSILKESEILRYLQSSHYEFKKAYDAILNTIEWRSNCLPIKLTSQVIEILKTGFMYICGRDTRFRPNIIICPSKYKSSKYKYEDWLKAVIFTLEYILSNMLIPGQIENWNIICDLSNISLYSIPSDLKKILQVIQDNYKSRLNAMYIINLGSFGNLLWGLIKKMLGDGIERKIRMIGSSNKNYKDLYKSIHRSQLEKKYGGEAENIFTHHFPPCMPSKIFFDREKERKDLLSDKIEIRTFKRKFTINDNGKISVKGEEFYSAREDIKDNVPKNDYNIKNNKNKNNLKAMASSADSSFSLDSSSNSKESVRPGNNITSAVIVQSNGVITKDDQNSISSNICKNLKQPKTGSLIHSSSKTNFTPHIGGNSSMKTNNIININESCENFSDTPSMDIKVETEKKSNCAYICGDNKNVCIIY